MSAPFKIDSLWVSCQLIAESEVLNGYRRPGGTINEDHPFISHHSVEIVKEGGLLFRNEHDWKAVGESIDGFGNKSFILVPTGTDVWYLPKCSFEQSLKLLSAFDFPKASICDSPAYVRDLAKVLLKKLARGRRLAVFDLSSALVYMNRIDGDDLTTEEITELLNFNQEHFRLKYSKREFLDLRRFYRKGGFFVLGSV